jgi:hypothetical protein
MGSLQLLGSHTKRVEQKSLRAESTLDNKKAPISLIAVCDRRFRGYGNSIRAGSSGSRRFELYDEAAYRGAGCPLPVLVEVGVAVIATAGDSSLQDHRTEARPLWPRLLVRAAKVREYADKGCRVGAFVPHSPQDPPG